MSMVVALNHRVKMSLKRMSRMAKDARYVRRVRIVLLRSEGYSHRQIALMVDCSASNVSKVLRRFQEEGEFGLLDRRVGQGPLKLSDEVMAKIIEYVAASPEQYGWLRATWTLELMCLQLETDLGVRVCRATMSKALKILGARRRRPKPFVECPWSLWKKTRALNKIDRLKNALGPGEVLLYMDEADVHLNPKIGMDWMLRGHQKKVRTPGTNERHCIAGALNPSTGHIIWIIGQRRNSVLFIRFLSHLLSVYRRFHRIHLVVDNCGAHGSAMVKKFMASLNGKVVLHFLPPYCPEHNPIERLWKQFHDNVTRNHTCRTIEQLFIKSEAFLMEAMPLPGAKPSAAKAA